MIGVHWQPWPAEQDISLLPMQLVNIVDKFVVNMRPFLDHKCFDRINMIDSTCDEDKYSLDIVHCNIEVKQMNGHAFARMDMYH